MKISGAGVILLVVLALVMFASNKPNEPAKTVATAEAVATRLTPACESVVQSLASAISSGLTHGAVMQSAQAVRSPEHERIWYVAARLGGPGISNAIGVWATNTDPSGASDPGVIFAVGGIAHQFSDWGQGERTKGEFSIADKGASAAEACVR